MTNSSCNNTCAVDNESGLCGCGRAQNEIANWFFYTEKKKEKLYSI